MLKMSGRKDFLAVVNGAARHPNFDYLKMVHSYDMVMGGKIGSPDSIPPIGVEDVTFTAISKNRFDFWLYGLKVFSPDISPDALTAVNISQKENGFNTFSNVKIPIWFFGKTEPYLEEPHDYMQFGGERAIYQIDIKFQTPTYGHLYVMLCGMEAAK